MRQRRIPAEQKAREGVFLKRRFDVLRESRPDLTQELFAHELGLSQGLIGQWFSGKTNIPDKRMLLLGEALGFDPFRLRPSLRDYLAIAPSTPGRSAVMATITNVLDRASDADRICAASPVL